MKRNTVKLFGITTMVLLLATGCGKVPKLENGQDAVASLKNGNISVDNLYNQVKEKYALTTLIDMMDTQILNEEYKDNKEIDKKVEEQYDYLLSQFNNDENSLIEYFYNQNGISSKEELTALIRLSYLRNEAITDYAKSIVSDKEIDKYYDEKIFGDISAKHILITADVSSTATDAEKQEAEEKALEEAKEVIKKLNNGEDWDKLAKEYSDDSSNKDNGGLLDDFVHGDMVEEFEVAAKNLEKGKYTTTAVKTTYGYHIIYKLDQKEKPELKIVKDDIIEKIADNKLNEDYSLQITALEKLREKYKMTIEDKTLKAQYEKYIKQLKEQANNQE